jgi:hypothetical protein
LGLIHEYYNALGRMVTKFRDDDKLFLS